MGFCDENPAMMEKLAGDFVFNPVRPGEFNLNEPFEILEGGTGFMLIQRQVFEAFDKKYPEMRYKPDHVRSKHFDGTRQISCYFDALIDRGVGFEGEMIRFVKELSESDKPENVQDKAKSLMEKYNKASNRYLSEDYMFNQYARAAGMKVWLCPWMRLNHIGSYRFVGDLPAIAAIGASATADVNAIKNMKG